MKGTRRDRRRRRRSSTAALAAAARAIRSREPRHAVCHVSPDGDALGSTLALHHVLLRRGHRLGRVVPVAVRGRAALPRSARPRAADAARAGRRTSRKSMVTFDCGDLARLGDLETNAKAADELIVIDHHASNARYGTINVIDVNAAASGVLVRRLIAELGLPLTRDAAICLYAALVCDTGRFQYESTTCAVFELARGARRVRPADRVSCRARCSRSTGSRTSSSSPTCSAAPQLVRREAVRVGEGHAGRSEAARRHLRRGRRHDRPRAPHPRGRGLVRVEGSRRRRVAGQPALARRGRRVPHRAARRRRRPPLRGRLHQRRSRRSGRRAHPRRPCSRRSRR